MEFNDDAQLDTSQIDDRESQGGGGGGGGGLGGLGGGGGFPRGRMAAGGGMGIVLLILGLLFGNVFKGGGGATSGNNGGAGGGGIQLPGLPGASGRQVTPQSPQFGDEGNTGGDNTATSDLSQCRTGADANRSPKCALVAVVNSVQAYWSAELPRRGKEYTKVDTVFFRDSVDTGCGGATSETGPFYCPADSKVYLDRGFFDELESKFGAQATLFAQAYVIAHEYGHHLQNLLGISDQVQQSGDREGPQSASVRQELQADCFAGVWANNATSGPRPIISNITQDDIQSGIAAAAAVGDDRIQKRMAGRVIPEKFTHGTSEQRVFWFTRGLKSGELTDCDTFNADI